MEIKDDPSKFDSVRTSLLGTQLLLSGRANHNEMFDRMEFIARSVKLLDVDAEIARLKQRVGAETAAPLEPGNMAKTETPTVEHTPTQTATESHEETTAEPPREDLGSPEPSRKPTNENSPTKPVADVEGPEPSTGELDDFDIDEELI